MGGVFCRAFLRRATVLQQIHAFDCTGYKSLFMFLLLLLYSCTVAVTGPAEWLQTAESSSVRWGVTVSQPVLAVSPPVVSDRQSVVREPQPGTCSWLPPGEGGWRS